MARLWLPIIRLFLRDVWVRIFFGSSLFLTLLTLLALIRYFPGGENVPLHYNTYFGIDFIGNSLQVYWLPMSALVLTVANGVVAMWIWRRDRIISYFLAVGSVAVTIILSISAMLAILLNR